MYIALCTEAITHRSAPRQVLSLADCQNISNSGVKTLLHGPVTSRSLLSLDVSRCAKITGAAFSDLHVKVRLRVLRCTRRAVISKFARPRPPQPLNSSLKCI